MDLSAAKALLEGSIPFVANTGLRVLELRRGHVKCSMPAAGNANHLGTMYAGALFTLAELPGGALFLSSFDAERFYPVVKALDLRFLKPAQGDITVTVGLSDARIAELQALADARGKAEFALDAALVDEAGEVVAQSHGVYQIRASGR